MKTYAENFLLLIGRDQSAIEDAFREHGRQHVAYCQGRGPRPVNSRAPWSMRGRESDPNHGGHKTVTYAFQDGSYILFLGELISARTDQLEAIS